MHGPCCRRLDGQVRASFSQYSIRPQDQVHCMEQLRVGRRRRVVFCWSPATFLRLLVHQRRVSSRFGNVLGASGRHLRQHSLHAPHWVSHPIRRQFLHLSDGGSFGRLADSNKPSSIASPLCHLPKGSHSERFPSQRIDCQQLWLRHRSCKQAARTSLALAEFSLISTTIGISFGRIIALLCRVDLVNDIGAPLGADDFAIQKKHIADGCCRFQ